jgi:hypothetical protein
MFLLSLTDDFIFHSDMCRKINYIPHIQTIIDEPLELKQVDEAMVNYNYSLGFEVDRALLNQFIDGQNGFISRYNNALATSVTIELPYEPPPGSSIKRRKNKVPHSTFLVYKSGSVTQSGPGGKIMRDAYYLFMNTIVQLQPYIQYNPNTISTQNIYAPRETKDSIEPNKSQDSIFIDTHTNNMLAIIHM